MYIIKNINILYNYYYIIYDQMYDIYIRLFLATIVTSYCRQETGEKYELTCIILVGTYTYEYLHYIISII